VLPNAGGPDAWAALSQQELPRLRAVQLGSAGYDHMTAAMPPGVRLCNAAGVHDAGTAELALALALANLRGLDVYARDQAAHRWQGFFAPSLADRRALIFGYGRIGAAVERRLAPFEPASVVRVARRPRSEPEVHPVSELLDLLAGADLVFITAPATPDTTGAIDAAALAALPDGALVVNVGRGTVIDTDAMVAEAGRLRFALDVTDPEPLPADHPLWDAPNVTIAPHVGEADVAIHLPGTAAAGTEPPTVAVEAPAATTTVAPATTTSPVCVVSPSLPVRAATQVTCTLFFAASARTTESLPMTRSTFPPVFFSRAAVSVSAKWTLTGRPTRAAMCWPSFS